MQKRRPLRLPGFDAPGCRCYFLTYRTFARARVFVAREPVALVSAQFLRAASEERFDILTYCFMPDHVHLLVEAVDNASDNRAFFSRSRQLSGSHYGARTGQRLWARDSCERVLRDSEASRAAARHILANPVRARFVTRPPDYPFSGSYAWDRQALLEVFVASRYG